MNYNQSGGAFECELPDLDSFIKELDLLDENVKNAVRQSMHDGADIILAEQRRLADETGVPFLAEHIHESRIYTTKKGTIGVTTGYFPNAFDYDDSGSAFDVIEKGPHAGVQPGVVGLTFEFGRPGQSNARSGEYRYWRYHSKNAKRDSNGDIKIFKSRKGKISPRPHIRRGFDNKIREATEKTIEALERETGKVFNE